MYTQEKRKSHEDSDDDSNYDEEEQMEKLARSLMPQTTTNRDSRLTQHQLATVQRVYDKYYHDLNKVSISRLEKLIAYNERQAARFEQKGRDSSNYIREFNFHTKELDNLKYTPPIRDYINRDNFTIDKPVDKSQQVMIYESKGVAKNVKHGKKIHKKVNFPFPLPTKDHPFES